MISDINEIVAGESVSIALPPHIARIFCPTDVLRLISAYRNGLLKSHDNDLALQKDKAIPLNPDDKQGKWLIHNVQYEQVNMVWNRVDAIALKPLANYPEIPRWLTYCLDVWIGYANPSAPENEQMPVLIIEKANRWGQCADPDPFTLRQLQLAVSVFCQALYEECFV